VGDTPQFLNMMVIVPKATSNTDRLVDGWVLSPKNKKIKQFSKKEHWFLSIDAKEPGEYTLVVNAGKVRNLDLNCSRRKGGRK